MTALEVLRRASEYGMTIERHGDRLRMHAPTEPPATIVDLIRRNKPALLDALPDRNVRPVLNFRLPGHAAGAVATALGRPGETADQLHAELQGRFGDGLEILPTEVASR